MRTLEQTLEEIKQLSHYAVTLSYGADIGADDTNVPQLERRVCVIAVPTGYLAGLRRCWVGSLGWLLTCDLDEEPTVLPNPPQPRDLEPPGLYLWGNELSVARWAEGRGA